jgi:hypothetical protein
MYDEGTQEFSMDYDTQEAKFDNCPIYDNDRDEWVELESSIWEDDNSAYNRSGDALAEALRTLTAKEEK